MTDFEKYRIEILRERISFSFMKTAIPFYLGASILDWVYVPNLWLNFLVGRILSCICFGVLGFAISSHRFRDVNLVRSASYLVTSILGIGLGYMTWRTGGLESPYYAGINWVGIGALAFLPGRHTDRIMWVITTYVPVFIFVACDTGIVFSNVAMLSVIFMIGTILLSIISNVLSMRSLRTEFNLRGQLQELVRDKDRIIEVKSTEAANLKRLAKQFSPAVIKAIESHAIALDERKRRKVAILFVDVVGSTSRSNSLDHSDYQSALDIFFELAIKTLMSHNITVANFMGDGLMAIANAPFPMEGFEKIALESGLEILEATQKRQRSLRQYWHEEFHIRIGISSGFANVGFFPNTDFGVYTAIGDSVNLAARLCSNAESSSLATTKDIIMASQDALAECNVKRADLISTFKGFNGHEIEYYLVKTKRNVPSASLDNSCPLCAHELKVATDLGDSMVIRCTNCQYSDILNKPPASDSSAA